MLWIKQRERKSDKQIKKQMGLNEIVQWEILQKHNIIMKTTLTWEKLNGGA